MRGQRKVFRAHAHAPRCEAAPCTQCTHGACVVCSVEHPPHLQVDNGSSFGPDESSLGFYCSACDRSYTMVSEGGDFGMKNKRLGKGPRWCYSGQHTLAVILPEDKRRNYGNTFVKLEVDGDV